jgi:hypothetical protein
MNTSRRTWVRPRQNTLARDAQWTSGVRLVVRCTTTCAVSSEGHHWRKHGHRTLDGHAYIIYLAWRDSRIQFHGPELTAHLRMCKSMLQSAISGFLNQVRPKRNWHTSPTSAQVVCDYGLVLCGRKN